jgi:hypothetical protein
MPTSSMWVGDCVRYQIVCAKVKPIRHNEISCLNTRELADHVEVGPDGRRVRSLWRMYKPDATTMAAPVRV